MKKITLPAVVTLLAAAIYYYMFLPAINIHSGEFWSFLIIFLGLFAGLCALTGIQIDQDNTIYYGNGVQGGQISFRGLGSLAKQFS